MTPAERKKAERARKRAAGLVPVEIWAKPEHVDAIKTIAGSGSALAIIAEFRERAERAERKLAEATDSLAEHVERDYPHHVRCHYPDLQKRWKHDMDLVNRFCAILARINAEK